MKIFQHSIARLFDGIFTSEALVASAPLLVEVTDQDRRPTLIGTESFAASLKVTATGSNQAGPTYTFWNSHVADWEDEPVFVVIETSAVIKVTGETPEGVGTWILTPTNSATDGVHKAQFQFMGYIESLTLQIPSIANGGIDGVVNTQVFLMPALDPTYIIGLT